MNTVDSQPRVDLLILARLATAGPRPLSVRKLEEDLFRFVEARLARREWTTLCGERLAALLERGDVDERRAVTATGLARLREGLGVDALPSTWAAVWQALVPALALALPGTAWTELKTAGKLRARLIRQHHGLAVSATPTLAQAVDAQAWQQLGVAGKGSLTAAQVKLALMQQALGIPVRTVAEAVNAWCWTILGQPPQVTFPMAKLRRVLLERTLGESLRAPALDAGKVAEWLSTKAAGTTTSSIESVRRALVSRWLFGGTAESTPPASEAVEKLPSTQPIELEPWARQVQAVAEATEAGREGPDRVFIASVWRALESVPALAGLSLEAFKARLVEANRAGLLRLHRADLANLLDRALVQESETQHLTATFHFIETSPRRPS